MCAKVVLDNAGYDLSKVCELSFALSNTWVSESELSDHFFFGKTASIPEYPRKSSVPKLSMYDDFLMCFR